MRETEADTCRKYVLPKLAAAGWTDELISEQVSFTDGRVVPVGLQHRRGPGRRADYLLKHRPDFPIAVVEAKASYKQPADGLQQAMEYAEILDLKFAYATNGKGIVEHDYVTGKERRLEGFPSPQDVWARLKGEVGLSAESDAADYLFPFNRELRLPDGRVKELRYYQRIAVERTIRAILQGRNRILLTMATGTGKTFTAVQIAWKLWKTRRRRRILYLADRRFLIDQPIHNDFRIFGDAVHKIEGEAIKSREIYFALYQSIAQDERRPGLYKEYPRDFFDLVIVDECHRGSAADESNWREILEYFKPATQIGMTATPRREHNRDTYEYFGNPVYTYTLQQGIDDGFLAPYRVYRVMTSADAFGFRPEPGQRDREGRVIPEGEYGTRDFERPGSVSLPPRTETVARHLTSFLKRTGRMAKTIVFCRDQEHAGQMREALQRLNEDLTRTCPHYVVRITSDEGDVGASHFGNFADPERDEPVIVTTSKLLAVGVDVPTCKNIVIFKPIDAMTEFKQIIGRGTRICEEKDKLWFNILDYTGATKLFKDEEFDGKPEELSEEEIDEKGDPIRAKMRPEAEDEHADYEGEARRPPDGRKYVVENVTVVIANEAVYELDPEGKTQRVVEYRDYTAEHVRRIFRSPADLRQRWLDRADRRRVLEAMEECGISFETLVSVTGHGEADPLDLLLNVAWNAPLRTRRERAERVRRNKADFFERFGPAAREVLDDLLDKYTDYGVNELDDLRVLETEPIARRGTAVEIARLFGGPEGLREALEELQRLLYAA